MKTGILNYVDTKPLDSKVELQRIYMNEEVYLLKSEFEALQYFKKGNVIWYRNGDDYLVYTLTQDLPSNDNINLGISAKMILDELKERNHKESEENK